MCTVSYVHIHDTVIITSNRDENILRETAREPAIYHVGDKKLMYPSDPKAGGTWFAAGAVLLNGAFTKHRSSPPYQRSRGLVLLDIAAAVDSVCFFNESNLSNIEPFTVITFNREFLYELRWDGHRKFVKELSRSGDYIWSSVTLYSDDVIAHRKQLFDEFSAIETNKSPETIFAFHNHNNNDTENGFVIDRNTGMKTFSITQAVINPDSLIFTHADLMKNSRYSHKLLLQEAKINS
jgi:hypothetical protein